MVHEETAVAGAVKVLCDAHCLSSVIERHTEAAPVTERAWRNATFPLSVDLPNIGFVFWRRAPMLETGRFRATKFRFVLCDRDAKGEPFRPALVRLSPPAFPAPSVARVVYPIGDNTGKRALLAQIL
jgi:hypothetical protein